MEKVEEAGELLNFFSTIYGDLEGYAYIAFKAPNHNGPVSGLDPWRQEFFAYPGELQRLVSRVREQSQKYEVYFGPAIYIKKRADKKNVVGTRCFWIELDGKVNRDPSNPNYIEGIPEPSIKVRTSEPDHEHWYWLTDENLEIPDIEHINKSLTYSLGADITGWDSTQILRPPETLNHKKSSTVSLVSFGEQRFSKGDFSLLPNPPASQSIELSKNIPAVDDTLAKYKFKANVWMLFKKGVQDGESGERAGRAMGLMALGYYLAEMQMQNEEILSILLNADSRWGKFAGRSDQEARLLEIVSIARGKYPLLDTDPVGKMETFGFQTFLSTDINLEWVWDGLLQEAGYFLLTGPPAVGKTQFALDFGQQAAMGRTFLGRDIPRPRRVGFVSLEMGFVDLKYFVQHQANGYGEEEYKLLEENFKFLPIGEPLYLSNKTEQDALEEWIFEERLDGIIIDSMGSTTEQSLSQEEDVKAIMDFNDRLRQRHNLFTWYVHHHRKSSGDNKRPNKLDDVYGNRYITARATTVYCLWDAQDGNSIQGIPLKVRLAAKPPIASIYRDTHLHFTLTAGGITVTKADQKKAEMKEQQKIEKEKEKNEANSGSGDIKSPSIE